MTAKFTAARRDAFLRALAQTGNQTISAERAKVSRSWVHLHQSTDPEFRARMDAAIAAARASFDVHGSAKGSCGPSKAALRWQDGAELVVSGSNGRRTQIRRARPQQWSPRVEERFIAALETSCNVKAACAEVGLTAASAYGHRHRWPAFARRWDLAVETGYVRLEAALVELAGSPMTRLYDVHGQPTGWRWDGPEVPEEAHVRIVEMTTAQAIHLLHMHKHAVRGIGKRPGQPERVMAFEEAKASLLRKIEAIARHREHQEMKRTGGMIW